MEIPLGKHYRGTISGDPNSIAAISIFEDEVIGLLSNASGNVVLGKLKDQKRAGKYIIYNDQNLNLEHSYECLTKHEHTESYTKEELTYEGDRSKAAGDCLRFYIEVDHDIYTNKGRYGTNNSLYNRPLKSGQHLVCQ